MKNVFFLLALLAMAIAAAGPLQAQSANTNRIEITVLDEQGLPVLGAEVTASQKQANLSRTATRSSDRLTLQGLAPGVYTVRVSAAGFQSQELSADLQSQNVQTFEVRLKPAGITEQLVVTATRSEQRIADVPASVNVVSNEQIE